MWLWLKGWMGRRGAGRGATSLREEGKATGSSHLHRANDLTAACLVLQGSKLDRAIGEVRWGRIEPPGRPTVAYRVFFNTPRTLSRPS